MQVRCPAEPLPAPSSVGIPSIVHFVYGLKRGAPFKFTHYAAVRSAIAVHEPTRVLFHLSFEPTGSFWQALRPSLELVWLDSDVVRRGAGVCLRHVAHQADFVRLQALQKHGGIYLDIDTFSLAPLPAALRATAEFVAAVQDWASSPRGRSVSRGHGRRPQCTPVTSVAGAPPLWRCEASRADTGLCNAIMAAAPLSRFVSHWLRLYGDFRSRGKDDLWAEHSVYLPARLAEHCDTLNATVLPPRAFFPFYWDEAPRFLRRAASIRGARAALRRTYSMHLWGAGAWALDASDTPAGGPRRRGRAVRREARAPQAVAEPCSAAFERTLYGRLACPFAGNGSSESGGRRGV